MTMEKEVTGLCHPMDAYREAARNQGAVSIGIMLKDFAQVDAPHFQDGQKITLAGVVSASKTKAIKTNSLMAYVIMKDDTGSIEMLAFSRVLEESCCCLQANKPVRPPRSSQAVLYFADSKSRLGARCLLDALLQALKEYLGEENMVLK